MVIIFWATFLMYLSIEKVPDPVKFHSIAHGVFQAIPVLEWVAISFSRGSSQPKDQTWVSRTAGRRFTIWASREAPIHDYKFKFTKYFLLLMSFLVVTVLVTQSCPTFCYRMDYSLPGSSVHGTLQARILEWVNISFSRGSSWLRDQTQVFCIAGRFFTVWA